MRFAKVVFGHSALYASADYPLGKRANQVSRAELLQYLVEQVEHFETMYPISRGQAFMLWYAIAGLGMDQDAAFEAVSYDGANDKGIDLFYVDDEYQRIIIAQGKFHKGGKASPKAGALLELVHTTDWLSDPEALRRDGRPDLAAAAEDYLQAIEKGYSVEYIFVYCGAEKKELSDAATQFTKAEMGEVPSRSARVVSLRELRLIHEEYIDKSSRVEEATISIDKSNSFLQVGPYGRALVTNLPGDELRRLFEDHGVSLFDRNVRLFLGARKGGVNAGIRDTLADVSDRKNFWAYNNGLTIVCDRFEVDDEEGSVRLSNFSVVNGCQTTVSIANASAAAADDVEVLARIIASADESAVDAIITYTNSQNPIRSWDISSQDKNQKRLKKELAKDPSPFFYELRRGEKAQLTKDEKKRLTRDGRLQSIPHDKVSQYLAALKGMPVVAYKDKAKLFSTHKDRVFPEEIRAEEVIFAWQAGQAAEDVVRSAIREADERGDEDEVRILKRGGRLFVLSAMGLILRERNGGTYLQGLQRDVAVSKRTRERLEKYATVAVVWYVQAMKDMAESGADLAQLVKSQDQYPKIESKILASWKVQSLSKSWLDDALPKVR